MKNLDTLEVALFAKAFNLTQENMPSVLAKIECIDDLLSIRKETMLFHNFNKTRKGNRSKTQVTVDTVFEGRLQECITEIHTFNFLENER